MRLGAFHRQLVLWIEKPCVLTFSIGDAGELRVTGILRPYFSVTSLHGWALVPPRQHGGFRVMRLTMLAFESATVRAVVGPSERRRLRFKRGRDAICTLERDDAPLTGPPRGTRTGRYLYVGGRRRPVPEPWMLH